MKDAVNALRDVYLQRKEKNKNYSMRAFASFLEMSPGALSDIFARKRPLTKPVAERIATRIYSDPVAAENFLAMIQKEEQRAASIGTHEGKEIEIREATFALMADWLHLGVLSLFETNDFRPDAAWIAFRFNQPVAKVQQVLERLAYLGFLEETQGSYALSTGPTRTSNDVPSEAVRLVHKAILRRVIDGLNATDVAHRDVQSMTLAIDPKKIQIAKQLLQSFKKTLSDFLETGEKTEVYHFNFQLFPATEVRK